MSDKALVPVDQAGAIQTTQTQSLSLFDKIADPMKAIEQMGVFIAESGMFGKMNHNQGKVLAWHCLTKKKDPFEFKREYHILEDGQITKRSDAMAADFIRRGGKIKWLSDLNDDKVAKATFITRDKDEYTWQFAIDDADGYSKNRDGYVKKNWRDSAPDMLRARLISKSIRILDPEVNAGVYTPEELRDNQVTPVTPSPTGLFDQQPPIQPPETAAPIPTTAEVVNTAPPTQQTLPLSPAPPAAANPAKMLEEIKAKFKDFNSVQVDNFFIKKTWLKPGQALPELSDENIIRLHKNIDQIVPLCKAWIVQQEKISEAAAKKAGTK